MYTTGANIGRAAVYRGGAKVLASNHVNILRIREEDPEYVAFVLNSSVGRRQTRRYCSGSGQAEIYPKDIAKFLIPFLHHREQQAIVSKLRNADEARKHSASLVREALRTLTNFLG